MRKLKNRKIVSDRRTIEQGDVSGWLWVKSNADSPSYSLTKYRANLYLKWSNGLTVDVGCNTGGFTIFSRSSVGIDFVKKHLIQAKKDDPTKQIEWICTCAESLPFRDGVFGTVIMTELLEHYPFPADLLKEAKRIGKRIIVDIPLGYAAYHSLGHIWEFTEKSIANLVTKFFRNILFQEILVESDKRGKLAFLVASNED